MTRSVIATLGALIRVEPQSEIYDWSLPPDAPSLIDCTPFEFQVEGKPVLYNIAQELKSACESILPDTFAAIRELITTFEPEFQDELRNNIVLAGGGSQIKGLPEVIESNLAEFGAARVTAVDDPVYAGALGALKLAQDMPDSEWASA